MATNPITLSRLFFAGNAIVLLFYGIYLTIATICLHYFLFIRKRRRNWIMIWYTIATLIFTTVFTVSSTKFTELLLIESAVNPLPAAKLMSRLDILEQVVYSIKIWLADSLLLYRLWVVWSANLFILIGPSIFWLGSFGAGLAGLALYGQTAHAEAIVHLGVSFHACSVTLNVLATTLIAGRLLYHRRLAQNLDGATADNGLEHSRQYLSLLAVFVESGMLYTVAGLIYIPLYATNSDFIYVWAGVLEAASGIGPSLIVLRVALGVAVAGHGRPSVASTKLGSLHFGSATKTNTTQELSVFRAAEPLDLPRDEDAHSPV